MTSFHFRQRQLTHAISDVRGFELRGGTKMPPRHLQQHLPHRPSSRPMLFDLFAPPLLTTVLRHSRESERAWDWVALTTAALVAVETVNDRRPLRRTLTRTTRRRQIGIFPLPRRRTVTRKTATHVALPRIAGAMGYLLPLKDGLLTL